MKSRVRGLIVTVMVSLCFWTCGGDKVSTVPTPNGPTSGEYLFEGNGASSLNLSTIDNTTGTLGSPTLTASPANESSIYPGVAATPSNNFLYALHTNSTVIEGFRISGPGFQLIELPNAPFFPSAPRPFNSLTLHPSGKFLYVVESPATIEEFSINVSSGDLAHASAVRETADLRLAVIDPSGQFLFATDLTGGRIFGYHINQSDGSLSAIAGSPFIVPANGQPSVETFDSTGHFLYASLISGGVAAFVVNQSTGTLTSAPGSPFPTSNVPVFIAADPVGNFLYTCDSDGLVDGFAVNTSSGVLSPIIGSPVNTAPAPTNVVVDPSGKFVYVSVYPNSTIYGFSLDPATGSLAALSGSPFPAVSNPTNLFAFRIR
jgi:6-phosphogluconolactonase (cycloisomerase 2 family)